MGARCACRLRSGTLTFLILAMMAFAAPVWCQIDTGTILGTVSDPSGAVVPGAKVSLTNEGTNLTVTTTTGADGTYTFSPVKIGTYTVSVEASGFSKAVQTQLTVSINQDLKADIVLKPGTVTQTVEVTGAPPPLQTENASVGQVVNQQSINNLPLNGRNFTFLAQTVAGVNTPQPDTRGNAFNGAFSANGLRPAQNNYLLDGIDNNSDNVDFLNGTNYVVLPPPDALSEFKVQTSDYSAQYGRAGGAILNASIKSGTNQLHGDVWEFFRNDKLDAADFFEDSGGLKKGEYRLNQFGGTIGGPVYIPHVYNGKDKLFFFGDVEVTRRRQGSVFTNNVPTALERSSGYTNLADTILGQTNSTCLSNKSCTSTDVLGRTVPVGTALDPATMREVTKGVVDPVTGLAAANTGYVNDPFYTGGAVGKITDFTALCPSETACMLNQLPANRLDPNAIKLLNLYPAATQAGIINNQSSNPVLSENREAVDTRMDWNKSEKDQVFGTFSYVKDPQFIPGPFGGIADGGAFQQGLQPAVSVLGALSYTRVFNPTTVNEVRLGEDRLHTSRFGPVATQTGIPEQYGIQGIAQVSENGGLPALGISGLSTLGSNSFLPSDEITQTTQLTDNLTKIYGKHTFKMGMEFQHIKFSTLQPAWSHGQLNYDGNYAGIGMAQILLTPEANTVGLQPCTSTSGQGCAVNFDGGADTVFVSNFSPSDDGHNYWGAYFQDDWKITSKLTLNLGLRWEHFGAIEENHGRQGNFLASASSAEMLYPANGKNQALVQAAPQFISQLAKDGIALKFIDNPGLSNPQDTNFGPRVGLAYQINPKLVARTGFGMFYNAFENAGYGPNIGENFPFQFTINPPAPNGNVPHALTSASGSVCSPAATLEVTFSCISLVPSQVNVNGLGPQGLQYNFITPYTLGWNFTLQYELTPNMSLTAAYVGNGARHMITGGASNSPTFIETNPTATVCGPGGITPFPDFGCNTSIQDTQGNSNYASLQTSLEKRFSNGLNFLATYTWQHCRGDAADELNGGVGEGYRAPGLPGFGIQGDYNNCDYNITNVFHFSGGYQLPFGHGQKFLNNASGPVNAVLGGWQTIWNFVAEGGQPLTIGCHTSTTTSGEYGCTALMVPGQNLYGSGAPDHYLNADAFTQPCPPPGFTQPARCANVGTGFGLLGGADTQISGPGINRLDFSLFKQFQLSERYKLEFRSEFFNILNHPTFNPPNFGGNGVVSVPGSGDFLSTNFGAIGSTRFPFQDPRQIQFALKLYF